MKTPNISGKKPELQTDLSIFLVQKGLISVWNSGFFRLKFRFFWRDIRNPPWSNQIKSITWISDEKNLNLSILPFGAGAALSWPCKGSMYDFLVQFYLEIPYLSAYLIFYLLWWWHHLGNNGGHFRPLQKLPKTHGQKGPPEKTTILERNPPLKRPNVQRQLHHERTQVTRG